MAVGQLGAALREHRAASHLSAHVLTAAAAHDRWTELVKAADQDVVASAVFTDDDTFQLVLAAGQLFEFELRLLYTSESAAADYIARFYHDAGWRCWVAHYGITSADGNLVWSSYMSYNATLPNGGQVTLGTPASLAEPRPWFARGMVYAPAAGTLRYQFAQSAATAGTRARTMAGSVLRYRRLHP